MAGLLEPRPVRWRLPARVRTLAHGMKSLLLRLAAAALLVNSAALFTIGPAMAAEPAPGAPVLTVRSQEGEDDSHGEAAGAQSDVRTVAVWTIAGTLIGGVALAVLYLLKRRLGGFPKNPAWVAPITIMQSKDFPGEGYYGDTPGDAHGSQH